MPGKLLQKSITKLANEAVFYLVDKNGNITVKSESKYLEMSDAEADEFRPFIHEAQAKALSETIKSRS